MVGGLIARAMVFCPFGKNIASVIKGGIIGKIRQFSADNTGGNFLTQAKCFVGIGQPQNLGKIRIMMVPTTELILFQAGLFDVRNFNTVVEPITGKPFAGIKAVDNNTSNRLHALCAITSSLTPNCGSHNMQIVPVIRRHACLPCVYNLTKDQVWFQSCQICFLILPTLCFVGFAS